jgi:cell division protein FtsA
MVIAALDIGSSKITCFIAEAEGASELRIIGIGHERSRGIKAGIITDMANAAEAIRHAVQRAERMAEQEIREVYVGLAGGDPRSRMIDASVMLEGREVSDADIHRAFDERSARDGEDGWSVVHALPLRYEIDGAIGIRNPRGMAGRTLGVKLHLVSLNHGALRNLIACVRQCDLEVAAPAISGYAAGLACLVEDELDLGVTLLDLGAGTTSLSVFSGGTLVHAESFALGGNHVTSDLARGLSTPLNSAEQIKKLYASAIGGPKDATETIEVPVLGEDSANATNLIPRALIVGIVRPRLEEIFELARDRLESSGVGEAAGRRVVLTGGGSQLQGVRELATQILEKQIRLARPLPIAGLAHAAAGPEYAAVAGLLIHAQRSQAGPLTRKAKRSPRRAEPASAIGRFGHWLRENL